MDDYYSLKWINVGSVRVAREWRASNSEIDVAEFEIRVSTTQKKIDNFFKMVRCCASISELKDGQLLSVHSISISMMLVSSI